MNDLFVSCVSYIGAEDDSTTAVTRRSHALETLFVFVQAISRKSFGGWEFMEVCAGGVSQSDAVFTVCLLDLPLRSTRLIGLY